MSRRTLRIAAMIALTPAMALAQGHTVNVQAPNPDPGHPGHTMGGTQTITLNCGAGNAEKQFFDVPIADGMTQAAKMAKIIDWINGNNGGGPRPPQPGGNPPPPKYTATQARVPAGQPGAGNPIPGTIVITNNLTPAALVSCNFSNSKIEVDTHYAALNSAPGDSEYCWASIDNPSTLLAGGSFLLQTDLGSASVLTAGKTGAQAFSELFSAASAFLPMLNSGNPFEYRWAMTPHTGFATFHVLDVNADVTWGTEAVPTPGTAALLGLGGLALAGRRRRRS